MKRLYFLVPSLKDTQSISQELEHTGIKHRHIHVLGKRLDKIEAADVHAASVLQTTSLIPILKKGFLFSLFLVGCLFILYFLVFPTHMQMNALGIAAIFVFGGGFGMWVSGMVGLSTKDPVVAENDDYIAKGHFILMADVPNDRVEELSTKVIRHHAGTKVVDQPVHH